MTNIKQLASLRFFKSLLLSFQRKINRVRFNETKYWEERYLKGGDSGVGSHAELAQFKANTINLFIEQKKIKTVIEFGCGDGNQLSLYKIPKYIGLDISQEAINLCQDKFKNDNTKEFKIYDGDLLNLNLPKAELVLSIDVLFHLTHHYKYKKYIESLFNHSKKFVVIYSTNFNKKYKSIHQVDRKFSDYISQNISNFRLIEKIENPYKGERSMADFYIYVKT